MKTRNKFNWLTTLRRLAQRHHNISPNRGPHDSPVAPAGEGKEEAMNDKARELGRQPAFPCDPHIHGCHGMTIRQQFAMAAMQGILTNGNCHGDVAPMAIREADSLLEALAASEL